MDYFDKFIKVLETSVSKNSPTTVLTLGHILNIAKLSKKLVDQEEEEMRKKMSAAYDEIFEDQHKYGSN